MLGEVKADCLFSLFDAQADGYLEQFNATLEELDYGRCTTYFKEGAGRSPGEIIDHLYRRLDEWRGEVPQGDDVTLVVLEAKV